MREMRHRHLLSALISCIFDNSQAYIPFYEGLIGVQGRGASGAHNHEEVKVQNALSMLKFGCILVYLKYYTLDLLPLKVYPQPAWQSPGVWKAIERLSGKGAHLADGLVLCGDGSDAGGQVFELLRFQAEPLHEVPIYLRFLSSADVRSILLQDLCLIGLYCICDPQQDVLPPLHR